MAEELIELDSKRTQVIVQELKRIEDKYGVIEPQKVVEAAKAKNSVLHQYFDWDDANAADNWRLQQARVIIATVRVEILGQRTKQFYHTKVEVSDGGFRKGYMSVQRIMADEELFERQKQELLERIEYWQTEAERFQELQGIVNPRKLAVAKRKIGLKNPPKPRK